MDFSWKSIFPTTGRIVQFITAISCIVFSIFGLEKVLLSAGLANNYVNGIQKVAEFVSWAILAFSLRSFIFDLKKEEIPKYVCFVIMFFCTIFIYTTCRQVKDAMLISKKSAKASTFAKVLIMAVAVIWMNWYKKVSKWVSAKNFGYFAILPIVGYYIVFSLFLYNNPAVLLSAEKLAYLKSLVPFLDGFIDLLEVWPVTLYYIFSELFAVSITGVFFWQMANQYVEVTERKRFYGSFLLLGQYATLFVGQLLDTVIKTAKSTGKFALVANSSTIAMAIAAVIMLVTINYLFSNVLKEQKSEEKKKKEAVDISFMDLIKQNKNYLFVALLVVYYGFTTVFLEQTWKDAIRSVYIGENAYASFSSWALILQSRISIVLAIIGGNFLVRKAGWLAAALVTPITAMIASFFVHGLVFVGGLYYPNLLTISVFVGAVLVGLFKSAKYALFDPTKERYIASQGDETKKMIKVLEGSINRIGKGGGAILMTLIFVFADGFGLKLNYASPSVAVGLFISIGGFVAIWIYSAISIDKEMKEKGISDN